MALHTLRRMLAGGIHDQLGGGYHRYAVDAAWAVPHFEKMLYDNAQLVQAHAARVVPDVRMNPVLLKPTSDRKAQVVLMGLGLSLLATLYPSWRAAKTERTVQLAKPIMVHIEYRTAFGMPDGMIRYRSDIYGRDAEVFQALEAAGVAMPAAQAVGWAE